MAARLSWNQQDARSQTTTAADNACGSFIVSCSPRRKWRVRAKLRGPGVFGQILPDQETNHFEAFVATSQVLDFGLIQNRSFFHDFGQLAVIDMFVFHLLRPPPMAKKDRAFNNLHK